MKLYGIPSLSCFGHDNNLIFTFAYDRSEEVQTLRNKLAKFVKFTKKSNKAKRFLVQCQKKIGRKKIYVLIQQVKTRWNSFYFMLKRFLQLEQPLALFFQNSNYSEHRITLLEWSLIRELVNVLESLYIVTKNLSGEKFTTISKVLPTVKQLIKKYSKENLQQSEIIQEFQANLLRKMKKKFGKYETNQIFAVSALIDPCYKEKAFDNHINFVQACDWTKAEALLLFREENTDSNYENLEKDDEPPIKKKKVYIFYFL